MRPRIDPPQAADLLRWASHNGFTTHIVGEPQSPDALVLVRFAKTHLDVAHLRGADRTEVARVPRDENANIWAPQFVTFHYYGGVVDALLALKQLPPGTGGVPNDRYEPPREGSGTPVPLTVTDAERSKTTVRQPPRRLHDFSAAVDHLEGPNVVATRPSPHRRSR